MNPFSGFIITCLIVTCVYFVGLLHFLRDYEKDRCEMTYMFEYPQYVRISNKFDHQYKKYELYVYSEGKTTERARKMYFDGIPVLFIPGNAGAHQQVRSLSSIALRKALKSRLGFHFDYFIVNLNEEYSGLNGALLNEQLDYVNQSLYRILELYEDRKNPPKSIVLIGHSMGGILAARLVSLLPPDSNLVPIAITLATPIKRASIVLDAYMSRFYDKIKTSTYTESSTTLVSITGGFSDFLVPPALTDADDNKTLHIVTTHIPRSWLPANHRSILWCKQTVMAIVRALFDCIDFQTRQISIDSEYRRTVFNHHLVHHSGIKIQHLERYWEKVPIDSRGEWAEIPPRRYTIRLENGVSHLQWYMMNIANAREGDVLNVVAVSLDVVDWIYACNADKPKGNINVCSEAIHLTHLSEIAPSGRFKRRTLRVNLHELKRNNPELTHVVFRVLPTSDTVIFYVDIFNEKNTERTLTVNLPKWWSLTRNVIIRSTIVDSLQYKIILPQLQHIIQSYELQVEPLTCSTNYYHVTASLIVPWGHQNQHRYFTEAERKPLEVRLYSSRPQWANNQSAFIQLSLEPACTYKVSIRSSIPGTLGQMARNYTPLLFANIAIIVMMAYSAQLRSISKSGQCFFFFVAVKEGAKPYYIVTMVKLLSRFLSVPTVGKLLPQPDWVILSEEGSDFFLLPLIIYMCSVGIVWILALAYFVSLSALESTVHKLTMKFLARTVSFTFSWSDHIMSILHKLPFMVTATLIFLSLSTCGSLALCLGAVFYFLKLTQMSQDFVEDVVWYVVKKFATSCKQALFINKREQKSGEENTKQTANAIDKKTEIRNVNAVQCNNFPESGGGKEEGSSGNSDKKPPCSSRDEDGQKVNKSELQSGIEKNDVRIKEVNELSGVNKIEEHKDDADVSNEREEGFSSHNAIFYHSTIFFMWLLVTGINIPVVLTWAHNFKYSKSLQPDPSFIPGLALSTCSFALWQFDLPKLDRKWYKELGQLILAISVISLTYSVINIYRLNYFLTGVIVISTLHQMFAPKYVTEGVGLDRGDEDLDKKSEEHKKYDSVKAKWE